MEDDKKIIPAPGEEAVSGEKDNKKMKNLISVVILLAGLFVGSLFVDVAQMLKGRGFSQKFLSQTDVFSLDDKTWVAYTNPIVNVKVITDDTCEACNPDEILVWMRRVIPTMLAEKVDVNSEGGKSLIKTANLKTIPAFVFSTDIEKTDFYTQAQPIFTKTDAGYALHTAELGIPVGKYVETPAIRDTDIQIGPKDAKVKFVEYSDFQCPYCKVFQTNTMSKILNEYKDKILFVYKNFPLESHPQANGAALAAECANEQGKFLEYSDKLFANQSDWGQTEGVQRFKTYAIQLRLDTASFNKCLDESKYQSKIDEDMQEALAFGITGTPSIFINDQFQGGVAEYESLKKIIDEQLAE